MVILYKKIVAFVDTKIIKYECPEGMEISEYEEAIRKEYPDAKHLIIMTGKQADRFMKILEVE